MYVCVDMYTCMYVCVNMYTCIYVLICDLIYVVNLWFFDFSEQHHKNFHIFSENYNFCSKLRKINKKGMKELRLMLILIKNCFVWQNRKF